MNKPLILASASPRRHDLLNLAGLPHEILLAEADESSVSRENCAPGDYISAIAALKNDAVVALCRQTNRAAVVLSADTMVYFPEDDRFLGKPKDKADAYRMIESLSGKTHEVITGVVLTDTESGKRVRFSETTRVRFRPLLPDEIERYVESGEPMDKAGAYGIQNGACIFVEGIDGDYFNVMGLPLCRLSVALREFDT